MVVQSIPTPCPFLGVREGLGLTSGMNGTIQRWPKSSSSPWAVFHPNTGCPVGGDVPVVTAWASSRSGQTPGPPVSQVGIPGVLPMGKGLAIVERSPEWQVALVPVRALAAGGLASVLMTEPGRGRALPRQPPRQSWCPVGWEAPFRPHPLSSAWQVLLSSDHRLGRAPGIASAATASPAMRLLQ